jgi:hypothetical protein
MHTSQSCYEPTKTGRRPLHTSRRFATNNSIKLAEQEIKSKPEILLPTEYQQFAKVFSEKASERFPPSRPYDHAIELKPDAPATLPAKAIRLPTDELVAAKKFIDDNRNWNV